MNDIKQNASVKAECNPIMTLPRAALKKPVWIRVKAAWDASRFKSVKNILRKRQLHTVCEEATCPNIGECFGKGTATFMILGELCTRRCPFCNVGHGRPLPPDPNEPEHLAHAIAALKLRHVVITSVNRDDLRDGGAQHLVDCVARLRETSPSTNIELLAPDFRGRLEIALDILGTVLPNVLNHNLETTRRLYSRARPGANYAHSLALLKSFKARNPSVKTKSGLMVGLGETNAEIIDAMHDLRAHDVEMLTIGQYLAPSVHHLPVLRYVQPEVFEHFKREALAMGFSSVASAPMVRSSYHAEQQSHAAGVP